MRVWVLLAACLVTACGSSPPPPAAAPPPPPPSPPAASAAPAPAPEPPEPDTKDDDLPDTSTDEEPAPPPADPAEPTPPSTASYEQATSKPEPLNANDDRLHLTDNQLSGPMRGVAAKCKVPARAKVTIKTAVQFGRAIGVTVLVDMPALKTPKKPTKASQKAAKARQKAIVRIRDCVDHNVRVLSWPQSRRRDTITTTF
jgi:hypothetical protein